MTVVLLTAAVGMTLALQGWRSRIPDTDEILSIAEAHALLEHGDIPNRGGLTSYGSYFPPGTAWLAVPGVLAFSDLRLVEVVGSATLYIGSLVGIFLIAQRHFGCRSALLAIGLYGLSAGPLDLVSSLSPRGHPFFYIWLVYLTDRWAVLRDARHLAAALVIWAAGMYVHLELAPAVFILPAVWWFYRPAIRLRSLAVAAAVALVMWYPYLRFERTRHFADVKSQVLLQYLQDAAYSGNWCDPALQRHEGDGQAHEPFALNDPAPRNLATLFASALASRGLGMMDLLLANFATRILGGEFILLALLCGGLLCASVDSQQAVSQAVQVSVRGGLRWRRLTCALSLLVLAVLVNECIARWFAPPGTSILAVTMNIRRFQVFMALLGTAFLARDPYVQQLAIRLRATWPRQGDVRLLVIVLVVPWVILLFRAEPDRGADRMIGIWPLQVIVIAACTSAVCPQDVRRFARWAVPVLVALVIAVNPFVVERTRDWLKNGWTGADADEVRLVDRLAGFLRSEGKEHAAVGYLFHGGPPRSPDAEPSLQAAQFDDLLRYRHGISNTDLCAEGIAPDDEYRVAESGALAAWRRMGYVNSSDSDRFRFLGQFGGYVLYKRD